MVRPGITAGVIGENLCKNFQKRKNSKQIRVIDNNRDKKEIEFNVRFSMPFMLQNYVLCISDKCADNNVFKHIRQ